MSSVIVSGMSCHHCSDAVTKAMQAVPGSGEVKVDLESGRAEWTGDASVEAISKAIIGQGFEVK